MQAISYALDRSLLTHDEGVTVHSESSEPGTIAITKDEMARLKNRQQLTIVNLMIDGKFQVERLGDKLEEGHRADASGKLASISIGEAASS